MNDSGPPKPKRCRRWLRFSLRTLMLMVTAFAVWFGWQCDRARRQKASVAGITELGGTIVYDHEFDGFEGLMVTSMGSGSIAWYHSGRALWLRDAEPWGPKWLRRWMGEDFFQTVVSVNLSQHDRLDYHGQVTDDDLRHLRDLIHVRRLLLDDCQYVTDRGLEYVAGLDKLERLYLDSTSITDRGLEHLRNLAKLEYLSLEGTNVTDDGLMHLKQLRNLRWLNLGETRITDQGLQEIQGWDHLEEIYIHDTEVTKDAAEKARTARPPWINTVPPGVVG